MRDETIVICVAIVCITVLEALNIIFLKIDGSVLSAVIGTIAWLVARAYYKRRWYYAKENRVR